MDKTPGVFGVGPALDGPLALIPREEWAEEIKAATADELKYDGERVPINLVVELPFWLMTPDASVSLTFEGATVDAHIRSDFVEVGNSSRFHDSRINLEYIGPSWGAPVGPSYGPRKDLVLRQQRTVLVFDAQALREAMEATQLAHKEKAPTPKAERSRQRRINGADRYFQTLAIAHLPFVNQLVMSYRAVSQDPFAFDVSTWDVPLWWAEHDDILVRINLMPYKDSDEYPATRNATTGQRSAYYAIDTDSLRNQLTSPVPPSFVELLDAKSLLRRGRYNEAVRATVTAIEVEFESQLRRLYRERGETDEQINARLNESKLSFMDRVDEWEQLTQRRLPGPRISEYPHLNGLRLRNELINTRLLRHRIVHEGYRITVLSKGQANRAVDALTWLHEWLTGRDNYSEQHTRNGALFSAIFGMTFEFGLMRFEYTTAGVVVRGRDDVNAKPIVTTNEGLAAQFANALEPNTTDLELFAVMAFEYLGIGWKDGPPDPPGAPKTVERFRVNVDGKQIAVFLLETDGLLKNNALNPVISRMTALRHEPNLEMGCVCLIHHKRQLASESRDIEGAISEELVRMAQVNQITLIAAADLRCVIQTMSKYRWDVAKVKAQFVTPGRQGTPPIHNAIGQVTRLFEHHNVLEIQIDEGQTLRIGDDVCIRMKDAYYEQKVESLQSDRKAVESKTGPALVGITTKLDKKAVRRRAIVYKRDAIKVETPK
jgi:hypothetical protein